MTYLEHQIKTALRKDIIATYEDISSNLRQMDGTGPTKIINSNVVKQYVRIASNLWCTSNRHHVDGDVFSLSLWHTTAVHVTDTISDESRYRGLGLKTRSAAPRYEIEAIYPDTYRIDSGSGCDRMVTTTRRRNWLHIFPIEPYPKTTKPRQIQLHQ